MPYFVAPESGLLVAAPAVKLVDGSKPVSLGIVSASVLPVMDIRGEDLVLVVITNMSAVDTFNGLSESSPNGLTQWASELNDEFAAIGPLVTRRMYFTSDRLFIRITGNFVAAPATLRISATRLRAATRRG